MLLTITTTTYPATDLGYLLQKHPAKLQSFEVNSGQAHVFYTEATDEKCTAALLLEIDPVGLIRKGNERSNEGFSLSQYVNDRPYAASSFMTAAIAKVYSSALNGACNLRPELPEQKLALEANIDVLASKGGPGLIDRLFTPLGYELDITSYQLDENFPDWGESKYYSLKISHPAITLQELLNHLYVLIPALDNDKHYFIGQAEVEKLLEKGGGWLQNHPEKDFISRRYLKNLGALAKQAIRRLGETEELAPSDVATEEEEEVITPEKVFHKRLHDLRLEQVFEKLRTSNAKTVLDLGCGEGKLLKMLLKEQKFEKITGMDASYRALNIAKEKLYWDELSPRQKDRIQLIHGALTYRDKRLNCFDAAAIVEVIEHLDETRLEAFQRVVFEFAKPGMVIITTPNAEYNVRYELNGRGFRHTDHRFEWTRDQFETWANILANRFGYDVYFEPIGETEEGIGAPSQMAVFHYQQPQIQ